MYLLVFIRNLLVHLAEKIYLCSPLLSGGITDGTTDGATAIAKSFAAAHPRKIFYTDHEGHENRGMSASRNAGVRLAQGEYIAFLDADDIWLPDRLALHVDVMERHPDVAMFCPDAAVV